MPKFRITATASRDLDFTVDCADTESAMQHLFEEAADPSGRPVSISGTCLTTEPRVPYTEV